MIPNWLLGKSKSKLQEILGGGGGGTTYTAGDGIDISDGVISFDPETTPAIDPSKIDGLDDDLAALTPKSAISNPNILHNPWFQVNQRRTASASTSDVFLVDRWKTNIVGTSSGTYTVNSDGTITIATSQDSEYNVGIYQKRTDKTFDRLKGRKVTLSVMLADGTIYSGTIEVPHSGVINAFHNDDLAFGLDEVENRIFNFSVYPGKTVTIKALKLELGEISTLAMDTAPDMATELLKCQRYFIRVCDGRSDRSLGIGQARSTTSALIYISLPIELISWPQLVVSDPTKLTLRNAENYKTGTGAAMDSRSATTQSITIQSTGLTAGLCYDAYLASGATLDFSAEL